MIERNGRGGATALLRLGWPDDLRHTELTTADRVQLTGPLKRHPACRRELDAYHHSERSLSPRPGLKACSIAHHEYGNGRGLAHALGHAAQEPTLLLPIAQGRHDEQSSAESLGEFHELLVRDPRLDQRLVDSNSSRSARGLRLSRAATAPRLRPPR